MKAKVGLLIDLNSLPHFQKEKDVLFHDVENCLEDEQQSQSFLIGSMSSFYSDTSTIDSRLLTKIKQLEEFILEQLTKEGTKKNGKFNPKDVNFAYRYFNSSNYFHQVKQLQNFVSLDSNSYNQFETSLESEIQAYHDNDKDFIPATNKMGFVSAAFKGMISDLDWAVDSTMEHSSSVFTRTASTSSISSLSTLNDSLDESCKNIIYVFFRVPRDEYDMHEFVEDVPDKLDISSSSKQFLNAFIPKAFLEMVTHTYQIRVNFVDMWYLDGNKSEEMNYPVSITKVLRHLHGGQILPPLSKVTLDSGLPNWMTFLKNNLEAQSIPPKPPILGNDALQASECESRSSRLSSTPSLLQLPSTQSLSKLEIIMKTVQDSSNSKSDSKRQDLDKNRLFRKNYLLNSDFRSQSFSQPSLTASEKNGRIHKRFGSSRSNHTILQKKSTNPILPVSRNLELLDFYKTSDMEFKSLPDLSSSPCPVAKKVRRNLFFASPAKPNE